MCPSALSSAGFVTGNVLKVRSILVSYFKHMRLNVNGSIFFTKNEQRTQIQTLLPEKFHICLCFVIFFPVNVWGLGLNLGMP